MGLRHSPPVPKLGYTGATDPFCCQEVNLQFSDTYYAWLAGFIVLTGLSFVLKNGQKKLLIHLYLVFATLFVIGSIYTTLDGRKGGNEVFVESDKAELSLRMTSVFTAMKPFMKGTEKENKTFQDLLDKAYTDGEHSLSKAIALAPESSSLLAKRVVVHSEIGKPFDDDLQRIKKIDTDKARDISRLLTAVYVNRKISKGEVGEYKSILRKEMPAGWYQDVIGVQLIKASGTKQEYEAGVDAFVSHYRDYVVRLAIFMVAAVIAGLVGVIVIIAQIFLLPRSPTSEDERSKISSPEDWGWKVVYAVFIGWLSTEFLVGPLLKGLSKDLANIAIQQGAFTVALITAGLYLSQNLPALLYIWLFAFRSHKTKFVEGIRFRWRTERRGPMGLVLAGVLTWFAAIPFVVVSTIIATKLGSQGSTNPIVAIVLSSVKDTNPLAVVMFLITLGVLPALCEETLFRGFLYTFLRRRLGVFPSIVISATLFSLAHMDMGGALQLFVLGALFAFVFERTKSLLPAMVAHCLWNSATFLMALTIFG